MAIPERAASTMISQESIQTPYIPVYQRWIERYRRIAATPRVSGIFLNWNHYGFMPSRASELVKKLSGSIGDELVQALLTAEQKTEADIYDQRERVRVQGEREVPQPCDAVRVFRHQIPSDRRVLG